VGDLLQGTALIVGGMIIAFFAIRMFGETAVDQITTATTFSPETLASLSDAGTIERFFTLNSEKLTMFRPATETELPWTALIIGLWIPNFYYWGLNQYIIQRTLGSKSLAEGQKGVMFAAWLKLIIPFLIVIPGIIAFNLFSNEQRDIASRDVSILTTNAKNYSTIYFSALDESGKLQDGLSDQAAQEMAATFTYLKGDIKTPLLARADAEALYKKYAADKQKGALEKIYYEYDQGWKQNNPDLVPVVEAWNAQVAAKDPAYRQNLYGYKYDSAFGLLISKVLPDGFGIRGFIFAALLGAVVSSLAAMLNAASTIFTIDIYKKFLVKHASDRHQVLVGRISVLVFAVVGCAIAPLLANPNLGTIFVYIQEFQGFLSPGILAVFLFGLFSKRAPRFAGVLGIITSPIVYGTLYLFFNEIAFLNRMAITFGCSLLVMLALTLVKPLKQDVVLPVNEKMDMTPSPAARNAGIGVLVVAALLYLTFSGLWF